MAGWTASRRSPRPVKDPTEAPFEGTGRAFRCIRKPRPKRRSEGPGGALEVPGQAFTNTRDRVIEMAPEPLSGRLGAARSRVTRRLQGAPGARSARWFRARQPPSAAHFSVLPPAAAEANHAAKAPQSRLERAADREDRAPRHTACRRPWRASGGPATRWQATADLAGKVCDRGRGRAASLRESENN